MEFIIAQVFGIIGIVFWITSVQKKEQYKILQLQTVTNFVYTIQFIILGVYSAAAMNLVSTFRCLLFSYKRKNGKEISKMWLLIFIVLIVALGVLTYKDYLSLIPVIITLFYTVSSWLKNTKWLRIVFVFMAFAWIYYNFNERAYVNIIGNVFEIVSGIVSLIRYSKVKENAENN